MDKGVAAAEVHEGERYRSSRQTVAMGQELPCEGDGEGGGTGVAGAGVREGHGRRWGSASAGLRRAAAGGCRHGRWSRGTTRCYGDTSGAAPLRRHAAAWRRWYGAASRCRGRAEAGRRQPAGGGCRQAGVSWWSRTAEGRWRRMGIYCLVEMPSNG